MCGIVGYTGDELAKDILINGLKRLEYRGYDSAGVALEDAADGSAHIDVIRRVGKVAGLEEALANRDAAATCGIGHTRWATHGRPSMANAHPHTSCDGRIAIVHNGIIENFAELREELAQRGHTFTSDTDTEVFAHLIEEAYYGWPAGPAAGTATGAATGCSSRLAICAWAAESCCSVEVRRPFRSAIFWSIASTSAESCSRKASTSSVS